MNFTSKEKRDLFYAGIMLSLAFAILLSRELTEILSPNFIIIFFVAFFTAGIGFLLHELMHKHIAQKNGFYAEFRAYYKMLWLAIVFSFFGFIIAAPGGVHIKGNITKEKNGKISVVGPITNLLLAVLFVSLFFILNPKGILEIFLKFGTTINSLLAAFNMLPVMPFDGSKVLVWNKGIYSILFISSIILFIFSLII